MLKSKAPLSDWQQRRQAEITRRASEASPWLKKMGKEELLAYCVQREEEDRKSKADLQETQQEYNALETKLKEFAEIDRAVHSLAMARLRLDPLKPRAPVG